jgi:hypothetical protein
MGRCVAGIEIDRIVLISRRGKKKIHVWKILNSPCAAWRPGAPPPAGAGAGAALSACWISGLGVACLPRAARSGVRVALARHVRPGLWAAVQHHGLGPRRHISIITVASTGIKSLGIIIINIIDIISIVSIIVSIVSIIIR